MEALYIESLLSEIVGHAARLPLESGKQAPRWLLRTVDQLRAVDGQRLVRKLGRVSTKTAKAVSAVLVEMFIRQ